MKTPPPPLILSLLGAAAVLFASPGCRGPNRANIELRKERDTLKARISDLERLRVADAATIRALQGENGSYKTLPADRLKLLFTSHGLRIGRLTGGADLDPSKPGDEGIKVYCVPLDQTGERIKEAGSFTVEAFDLSRPRDTRIGRWTFGVADIANYWNGFLTQYGYVLPCPWQTVPAGPDVTVRITFTDELTGRQFTEQRAIRVSLPPAATTPATAASPRPPPSAPAANLRP